MSSDCAEKPNKRVALFIPGFGGGGAENVFVLLANYWSSEGFSVDYLVLNDRGPMRERLEAAVTVRVVDGGRRKITRRYRIAKGIADYCTEFEPVLLLSTLTYCNLSAVAAKRFFGLGSTRLVLREANSLDNIRKRSGLGSFFTLLAIRLLYRYADGVTANSEHTIRQLISEAGVPQEYCHLLRNPVADRGVRAIAAASSVPRPIVLGCGRLIPQKDFETLTRAVAEVRKVLDCKLIILGEGPERGHLEQLALELDMTSDCFELAGFVDDPAPYYASASVFALASRWEGLPNVVLEALSLGVPVVATDCSGGTREIFEGLEADHLVEVGDVSSLAEKILKLLEFPPPIEQMRSLVYPKYATGSIAEGFLKL